MEQRSLPESTSFPAPHNREGEPTLLQKNTIAEIAAARQKTRRDDRNTASALNALLKQERAQQENCSPALAMLAIAGMIACFTWLFQFDPARFREAWPAFLTIGAIPLLCSFSMFARRRKRLSVNGLTPITDKNHIGVLLSTLQSRHRSLREFAVENLLTLLPLLSADDVSLLKTDHRDMLVQQLAILPNDRQYHAQTAPLTRAVYRHEMKLRLAILQALEQVGGEQEIAAVEALAQGRSASLRKTPVPPELRDAAGACLPHLQARAADRRAEAELLRASSPSVSPRMDLLRPATTSSDSPPDQLLRAAEPRS